MCVRVCVKLSVRSRKQQTIKKLLKDMIRYRHDQLFHRWNKNGKNAEVVSKDGPHTVPSLPPQLSARWQSARFTPVSQEHNELRLWSLPWEPLAGLPAPFLWELSHSSNTAAMLQGCPSSCIREPQPQLSWPLRYPRHCGSNWLHPIVLLGYCNPANTQVQTCTSHSTWRTVRSSSAALSWGSAV